MGKNLIRKSNSVNQGRSFTSLQMFHAHTHTQRLPTRYETCWNVNEATRPWACPKATAFAELAIGTAIRPSRERLRTVANGFERLRTQTQRRANTPSTPRPPEWNGNPCYAFGKKQDPPCAASKCTCQELAKWFSLPHWAWLHGRSHMVGKWEIG